LLLLIASFCYLCVFRHFSTTEPDEGILLQGAQRILQGQVLYRDFFSFYTPGSYYELALIFRVFGSSLAAARIALALTGSILSVIIYALARRVCSSSMAMTFAALATISSLPYRFLVLHNWDSTLWACLALYCAVRVVEHLSWKWPFLLGTFASLTALFEQSKGAGLCLGLAIGFSASSLRRRRSCFSRSDLVAATLGFSWPFLLTFVYFAAQHSVGTMISDWLWPLHHYSTSNHVAYGYQNWSDASRHDLFSTGSILERGIKSIAISPCLWIPALPVLALAFCFRKIQGSDSAPSDSYFLVLTGGYLGLVLSTWIVRSDIIHFMYLQPLNCLVLAWLLGPRPTNNVWSVRLRQTAFAYVLVAFVLFSIAPLFGVLAATNRIDTRRGPITTRSRDTVIDFVQSHVRIGEPILVYPYLPLYYYLTATNAPGYYEYFQPGMHTPEQAQQMIHEIEAAHPKVVLLEIGFAEKFAHSWPATPLSVVAKDPIEDFLLKNYQPCRPLTSSEDWRFLYMVERGSACP
jgi:hypothetical protein